VRRAAFVCYTFTAFCLFPSGAIDNSAVFFFNGRLAAGGFKATLAATCGKENVTIPCRVEPWTAAWRWRAPSLAYRLRGCLRLAV
jgi:hypothetical protein